MADWLIANSPSWELSGRELDNVPAALLGSKTLTQPARDRFITFMVSRHGDATATVAGGWAQTLDVEALLGRMQQKALLQYLENMAEVDISFAVKTPVAGDTVACSLKSDRAGDDRFSGALPWRCSVRLAGGAPAFHSGTVQLGRWSRDQESSLAWVMIPADAGAHELIADATVELTRDDLRVMYSANPHLRPPGFKIENWRDVRIVRRVKLPYTVLPSNHTAPRHVDDAATAAALKAAVHMELPVMRPRGTSTGGSVTIAVTNPPVSLAMRVIWVGDGREVPLDWFLAREGVSTTVTCTGEVAGLRGGPSKIILRPDLSLIDCPTGVTAVYTGPEIEFPFDYHMIR
jgi:hypothetical protein